MESGRETSNHVYICLCRQDVLKDMAAAGVSPNIDTFNFILSVLAHYKILTITRTWSLNVLSEINHCGLGNHSYFLAGQPQTVYR